MHIMYIHTTMHNKVNKSTKILQREDESTETKNLVPLLVGFFQLDINPGISRRRESQLRSPSTRELSRLQSHQKVVPCYSCGLPLVTHTLALMGCTEDSMITCTQYVDAYFEPILQMPLLLPRVSQTTASSLT